MEYRWLSLFKHLVWLVWLLALLNAVYATISRSTGLILLTSWISVVVLLVVAYAVSDLIRLLFDLRNSQIETNTEITMRLRAIEKKLG